MGLLVDNWPAGLGADASGVVVEAGKEAKDKYGFKEGDYVCGCTRIGTRQYATCREFFLMDAQVTMRKPSNISLAQAASVGAAFQTAGFGIFAGLQIPEPTKGAVPPGETWVLVLGGAGSVGRAGVQLAHAAGCKVIASCSEKSFDSVKSIGATAVFDYHIPLDQQLDAIEKATSGTSITKIFDATSADNPELAKALFKKASGTKLFSTTNDWSGIGDFEGGKTYEIHLGQLGRPDATQINSDVERWNPIFTSLIEAGVLHPMELEQVGSGGLEDAIKAYQTKAGSKKLVVKIQDEN
jgi:NADPH:quinone reductase-like Zn-dependent oxidoreductase